MDDLQRLAETSEILEMPSRRNLYSQIAKYALALLLVVCILYLAICIYNRVTVEPVNVIEVIISKDMIAPVQPSEEILVNMLRNIR